MTRRNRISTGIPEERKYLVIIYKEVMNSDGFIITAYYTVKPSERRRTIWKR
jgi:hypothetical protein